ncbi:hypothetical protein F5X96DRAFT_219975 [Biscogniauxia mediterranea]|nr:hypothetical protein F5X96DRAFT_219975 [Biscogniauxia mediterranea]
MIFAPFSLSPPLIPLPPFTLLLSLVSSPHPSSSFQGRRWGARIAFRMPGNMISLRLAGSPLHYEGDQIRFRLSAHSGGYQKGPVARKRDAWLVSMKVACGVWVILQQHCMYAYM